MSLETLKNKKMINGYAIHKVEWKQPKGNHIEINHKHNAITFRFQKGVTKKGVRNGCQVDELIAVAKMILEGLNKKVKCEENERAIEGLKSALYHLEVRTIDRKKRGVESTVKP